MDNNKLYDVIDLQQLDETDVHYFNQSWYEVKTVAHDIMKDRSENVDDELSTEFKEQIKNGVHGLNDFVALETLELWSYRVIVKASKSFMVEVMQNEKV